MENFSPTRLAPRFPLILLAAMCLVSGMWGGMARLYWTFVPATSAEANWISHHGPLMVCGFLGTLIALERAVAVARWWAYLPPTMTAVAGLLVVSGSLDRTAPFLFVLGSAGLLVVTGALFVRHTSSPLGLMTAGAAAWLAGNVIWFQRQPLHQLVVYWMGFLLLTVFAERLELGRVVPRASWRRAEPLMAAVLFASGLIVAGPWPAVGQRVAGIGMAAMGAWLACHDVARYTVRRAGPPRYVACCLMSGYVWLAFAGLGLAWHAPLPSYGFSYDTTLHAFFLGFVMSMIFAHAPIILPAVLGVTVNFHAGAWLHLIVLHVSLVLRVWGDLGQAAHLHGWGGILNAAAILLFAGHMATAIRRPTRVTARSFHDSRGESPG